MFAASKTGRAVAAGAATDQHFKNTVLLLNDTGTNGAQNNTFIDSSTNNFTITRNGNATQGSVNPYEPTGYWSGSFTRASTQYIYAANNAAFQLGSGNFTIEGWAFFSSLPTSGNLYSMLGLWDGTPYTQFSYLTSLYNNSGTYQLTFWYSSNGSSTPNITANWTPSLNTWYHLAFVRSSNSLYIFVNGTQVGSTGSLTASLFASTQPLRIGIASNTEHAFDGNLSNVRLVKGTALYTSNFTPPTTPLTAVSGTSLLTLQNNRFIDNSSNNFTITPVATPIVTSFSPFAPTASYSGATYGGSIYFDGTGDYLDVPNGTAFDFGTGDFTVEMFVYLTATPSIFTFMHGSTGTTGNFGFQHYLGLTYIYTVGGSAVSYTLSYTANTWTHLAVVRSGTTLTYYINGTSQGTRTFSNNITTTTGSTRIGAENAPTNYLQGYISNLRIVKGTAVYTASFTPPTAPVSAITNTQLLLNATNAGIYDATALNDMETVGNAQVSTTQYKWGASSMSFDGTGDYLTPPPNSAFSFGTGDFTIECWAYITGSVNNNGVFALGASYFPSSIVGIQVAAANLYGGWFLNYGSSNQIFGGSATANTWNHIAVARASGVIKLFINGAVIGSATDTTNYTYRYLVVGGYYSTSFLMTGYVEDFRVTKGIARYTTTFTPPTAAFPTR